MSRDSDQWLYSGFISIPVYQAERECLAAAEINQDSLRSAKNENTRLTNEFTDLISQIILQYKNPQLSWRILASVERIMDEYASLRFQLNAIDEDSLYLICFNEDDHPKKFVSLFGEFLLIDSANHTSLKWKNEFNYSVAYFMQQLCPETISKESQERLFSIWSNYCTKESLSKLSFDSLPKIASDPILRSVLSTVSTENSSRSSLLLEVINHLPCQDEWMLKLREVLHTKIHNSPMEILTEQPTSNVEHLKHSDMPNISL